jgi:hypothetical protein
MRRARSTLAGQYPSVLQGGAGPGAEAQRVPDGRPHLRKTIRIVQRLAQFAKPAHLESRATDSMCDDIVSSIGAAPSGAAFMGAWGRATPASVPGPSRAMTWANDLDEPVVPVGEPVKRRSLAHSARAAAHRRRKFQTQTKSEEALREARAVSPRTGRVTGQVPRRARPREKGRSRALGSDVASCADRSL